MLKSLQLKTFNKISAVALLAVLMTVLLSGASAAQKAPDFSNNLMMDNTTQFFFMTHRLEFYNMGDPIVLDAQGYIGKDLRKLWFEVEGEAHTAVTEGEVGLEALYGQAISAYFDARAGIRYDIAYNADDTRTRGFAVVGIQGLAPYLFEVDANLFVSEAGDISAEDLLELCADLCEDCAEECGKHDHDHCQDCAEACRECAEACRSY